MQPFKQSLPIDPKMIITLDDDSNEVQDVALCNSAEPKGNNGLVGQKRSPQPENSSLYPKIPS